MASILKQHGAPQRRGEVRAAAFNFDDVTAKAESYLAQVRTQAAEILADAQTQAQAMRDGAKRDGQRQALAEAERTIHVTVQQQLDAIVPAIERAAQSVERERAAWLRRWEDDAVKLAIAIAERVIRCEISQHPSITIELVREALQLATGLGAVQVCLHPSDHTALGGGLAKIIADMKQLAPTELVADATVSPGGCRVDTQFGSIDQQIESQLARIREELSARP